MSLPDVVLLRHRFSSQLTSTSRCFSSFYSLYTFCLKQMSFQAVLRFKETLYFFFSFVYFCLWGEAENHNFFLLHASQTSLYLSPSSVCNFTAKLSEKTNFHSTKLQSIITLNNACLKHFKLLFWRINKAVEDCYVNPSSAVLDRSQILFLYIILNPQTTL